MPAKVRNAPFKSSQVAAPVTAEGNAGLPNGAGAGAARNPRMVGTRFEQSSTAPGVEGSTEGVKPLNGMKTPAGMT